MNGRRWMTPWLLLGCVHAAAAADAPAGRHDPFARPDLAGLAAAAASGSVAAPTWQPRLRAVVMAGPRSMVLIDDEVVELGVDVNGYRLIRVLPDKAIFVRDGRRVVIAIGAARAP